MSKYYKKNIFWYTRCRFFVARLSLRDKWTKIYQLLSKLKVLIQDHQTDFMTLSGESVLLSKILVTSSKYIHI